MAVQRLRPEGKEGRPWAVPPGQRQCFAISALIAGVWSR